MKPDKYPLLAREGWPHVALVSGAAVLVTVIAGWYWAAPVWLATVFVVQFFRDPVREIPEGTDSAVCPADGRVVFVGPATDPYLNRTALKISIFMNVFNVHSNRSPVSGRIKKTWYSPGKFINAELDKASETNERNALWIKTETGIDVVCVQIAGLLARRILCYAGDGDTLMRGQRFGFIRFGSRVDLYLPADSKATVQLGDKVYGGRDLAAKV